MFGIDLNLEELDGMVVMHFQIEGITAVLTDTQLTEMKANSKTDSGWLKMDS